MPTRANHVVPASPRRHPPAAAWLILVAATACRSAGPSSEPPRQKPIGSGDLAELISRGALKPVEGMDGGDVFKDPAPSSGEDAFARAEEMLRRSDAGQPSPGGAQTQPATPSEPAEAQENPYLAFGKRIEVYPQSGLIMKPYPLKVGLGEKLMNLLVTYGNFPLWQAGGAPQTIDQVRMELLKDWDTESYTDMRQTVPQDDKDKVSKIADWLIVTTGPERLKEVESFINIFAAGVPQIEIEAKIVEVTLTDTIDLGVKPVNTTTPIFGFPGGGFVKGLDYNLPNTSGAINTFLTLGAVQNGNTFNAILEALATYENVSIISRPKIAVREGGRAKIENTTKIPNLNVTGITPDGKYGAAVAYEEVGIKLYVIPRVVGTRTVALNIDIEASAQSGSAVTLTFQGTGSTATGPTISNPIISKRAAQTIVYLEPGQAVILGGLITERTVDTENKVPFLGDIPILGYLFKSTYKKKEQTNVLFFIRPRILQGSDLNREF